MDGWPPILLTLLTLTTFLFLKVEGHTIPQKKRLLINFWKLFSELTIFDHRWRYGAKRVELILAFSKGFWLQKLKIRLKVFWPKFRRPSFEPLTSTVGALVGSQCSKSCLESWKILALLSLNSCRALSKCPTDLGFWQVMCFFEKIFFRFDDFFFLLVKKKSFIKAVLR